MYIGTQLAKNLQHRGRPCASHTSALPQLMDAITEAACIL
jgi:hypothetical protein